MFAHTLLHILGSLLVLSVASQAGASVCGAQFEMCCGGTTCNSGLVCLETCNESPGEAGDGGGAQGCPTTCLPCGGNSQLCCAGNQCNNPDALTCVDGMCRDCGAQFETCCGGTTCDSGLLCLETCNEGLGEAGRGGGAQGCPTTCLPCGGNFELCCAGDQCDNPDTTSCVEGLCRDCGVPGLGCCDTLIQCVGGFVCAPACPDQGQGGGAEACPLDCLPCGEQFQRCCSNDTCNSGLSCQPAPPCETNTEGNGGGAGETCDALSTTGGAAGATPEICLPCGGLGQPCCPGDPDTCDNENLLCVSEVCEACGEIGEQCCVNDTCPNSRGLCADGRCQPAPAPAMSGQGLALLILILTGIAFVETRRLRA